MEQTITTFVPESESIELVKYYSKFLDYYPNCEPETKLWCTQMLKSSDTVIDAGANIGYFSILFSRCVPDGRVYAFEPTETFTMLESNLQHNGCRNVITEQLALGDKTGVYRDGILRIWGEPGEYKNYTFTTLDNYVDKHQINQIDLIKVDIDGYEYEFLEGAVNTLERFDPFIVLELNSALATRRRFPSDILAWMNQKGYAESLILDGENFVFRRSGSLRESATCRMAYDMTFYKPVN